jgi:DNA-binding GntR family transcriptional regulator
VNRRFHGIIQQACPNRSLTELAESVGLRTLRYRRFGMTLPEHLSRSVVAHARIVEAIEAGDAEAAGKAAARAAQGTFKRVSKALRQVGRIG